MAAFAAGHDVVASGPTKTTVRTASGLTADLRVVPLDAWGAALQYFTGSAAHNVAVRQIAIKQKLKLSEYGLFDAETNELIVSRTEEEVYERLGLAWVPPAMREDRGEIEAAAQGRIPGSFGSMTCAGTCTRTPTSPTAWPRSRRWWPRRGGGDTSTTPSPTTRRT